LFLNGQRVISEKGEGEVVDAIGNEIIVKLESGETVSFQSADLQHNNDAG
jgi:hypothetical protein